MRQFTSITLYAQEAIEKWIHQHVDKKHDRCMFNNHFAPQKKESRRRTEYVSMIASS
jgi:hypothetical protein